MELRCRECGKLLTTIKKGVNIELEIKCNKCKTINLITLKSVREGKARTIIKND